MQLFCIHFVIFFSFTNTRCCNRLCSFSDDFNALTIRSKNKSRLKEPSGSLSETVSATGLKREKTKSIVDNTDIMSLDNDIVKIIAIYSNEYLTQLKFVRNKCIPRPVLQIIGLTIKFHKQLHYISINSGLDPYCIYEISKFLPQSCITDICFDGSFLNEANYHILLENSTTLKQLSLSKCTIDDNVVKTIAAKLIYPLPASQTLSILNLSCNKITNVGVKYLAQALRSNRQLSYLNLASNIIDDLGAEEIFSTLIEFPLTSEEALDAKRRLMEFMKKRHELINEAVEELRANEQVKKSKKKHKAVSTKKGKLEAEPSDYIMESIEEYLYGKARTLVEDIMGEFEDPFKFTVYKNGLFYCDGNNGLAYLNLAYNNISFCSIKKLLAVLKYQKMARRHPRGLVNVCIEGNPLPEECSELTEINTLIEIGFYTIERRKSIFARRQTIKK